MGQDSFDDALPRVSLVTNDPFAVPEDEPNPFAKRPVVSSAGADPALNPYAPTSHVSDTEGLESDIESFRRRYLSHEASVQSIGTLYLIPGVLLVGLFLMMAGFVVFELLAQGGNGMGLMEGVAVTSIYGGLGLIQIYTGLGLRRFKIGARRLATFFGVIGLLAFPFGTIINGYILYLLQSQKGKVVFSEDYQDVIRRTPHIKYRTSLIVKIFVVILVVLLTLGFVAAFVGV